MDARQFSGFLQSSCNFIPTAAKKQEWTAEKYEYIEQARPDYGLILLIKGPVTFRYTGGSLTADTGELVFLPKGLYYETLLYNGQVHTQDYLLNFDVPDSPAEFDVPVILLHNAGVKYIELYEKMISYEVRCPSNLVSKRAVFYQFLDCLIEDMSAETNQLFSTLRKAQALLSGDECLSVGEVAARCCVSESKLRRLFQRELGVSPNQYKLHIRMNQARYLLQASDLSVSQIAEKLHFYDAAYFSHLFLKHNGVSPTKYAQNKHL